MSNSPANDDTLELTPIGSSASARGIAIDLGAPADVTSQRVGQTLQLGQWYWVIEPTKAQAEVDDDDGDSNESIEFDEVGGIALSPMDGDPGDSRNRWLGCVMKIGSNYVELHSPRKGNSQSYSRVHLNDFWTHLVYEPNAEAIMRGRAMQAQDESSAALRDIQTLTARLGLSPKVAISGAPQRAGEQGGNALMVVSGTADVNIYKNELIEAKETKLPALFERVKQANSEMVRWMSAGGMTMEAMASSMTDSIDEIKSRIFTVSLYAGLAEEVVCCKAGEPAPESEKLRVMQRRLYMDEECLMHYRIGGMEFSDIAEFDAWLAEPEHMVSMLPFPRCMVAMRVRRVVKEREWDGSLSDAFVKMRMDNQDKLTFLYIRNGEQLHRLSTELEFGETIFPNREEFDPSEPLMFKMFGTRVDKIITLSEYEQRLDEHTRAVRLAEQWEKDTPRTDDDNRFGGIRWRNPYRKGIDEDIQRGEWQSFDQTSLYYDEVAEEVAERVQKYNRIAVIIQGLFDRSEVLHPHAPVQTWTPDGFSRAIELVYDGSDVLHNGEAPDFEAYRAACNALMTADSVVVGQERMWEEREAERENTRRDADYRDRSNHRVKTYRPYGDEGPGYLAKMASWKPKSRVAGFAWMRDRRRGAVYSWDRSQIACTLSVPADKLFNVDAYKPGDFKRFFADRRTRAQYLVWAPMLLTAEEYHAGKMQPQLPLTA